MSSSRRPGSGGSGSSVSGYDLQAKELFQLELGQQPSGFKSTIINDDRLSEIQSAHERLQNGDLTLDETVVQFGNFTLTEKDVIDRVIANVKSNFTTQERTIELPGVALNREAIYAVAAKFKDENDLGPIVPASLAEPGQNQAVFEFATPEVYNDLANAQSGVTGVNANNFIRQGNYSAGDTVDIVSDGGIAGAQGQTAHLELARDDDQLFFTGDVLDPLGDASLTKFQYANVDGNDDLGPDNALFSRRLSNLHIQTVQGQYVKTRVDFDGKVYSGGEGGAAEPLPVAFRLGQADNAQNLT